MAPINESASSSDDFAGDEFSNNLFSDLAPLLTLFGEQVTKQFLSMSMGWADNILLAMGPLGIVTTIVSAIRVGGAKHLKALIGRARESHASAEQELLSSTSEDVCEMWSGNGIVRVQGEAATKTLILASEGKGIYDMSDAFRRGYLDRDPKAWGLSKSNSIIPPNLTLNVQRGKATRNETYIWAAVGVLLQVVAIVIPGIATYHWHWTKAGERIAGYGYPCFVIGTVILTIGMAICGHTIENITSEVDYEVGSTKSDKESTEETNERATKFQIVHFQSSGVVGDQHFNPYILVNNEDDLKIQTSYVRYIYHSKYVDFASITALAGFVIQFVGLRALHWSATITQLGVTLIMTAVRSWIRRGFAAKPFAIHISEEYQAERLAVQAASLVHYGRQVLLCSSHSLSPVANSTTTPEKKRWYLLSRQTPEPDLIQCIKARVPVDSGGGRTQPLAWPTEIFPKPDRLKGNYIWEMVTGYDATFATCIHNIRYILETRTLAKDKRYSSLENGQKPAWFLAQQLFSPMCTSTPLRLESCIDKHYETEEDSSWICDVYSAAKTHATSPNSDVQTRRTLSVHLKKSIEDVMKVLANTKWIDHKNPSGIQNSISWAMPTSQGSAWEYRTCYQAKDKFVFHLKMVHEGKSQSASTVGGWDLGRHENIETLLGLWSYALSVRAAIIDLIHWELQRSVRSTDSEALIPYWDENTTMFDANISIIKNPYAQPSSIPRIVGTSVKAAAESDVETKRLQEWLGKRVYRTPLPDGRNVLSRRQGTTTKSGPFFGMFLSSLSLPEAERASPIVLSYPGQKATTSQLENFEKQDDENRTEYMITPGRYGEGSSPPSCTLQCARELFSLFILAVVPHIAKVKGTTCRLPVATREPPEGEEGEEEAEPPRVWDNTVFNLIAKVLVEQELATNVDDAYSLIVPAFAKHGLLPEESSCEDSRG